MSRNRTITIVSLGVLGLLPFLLSIICYLLDMPLFGHDPLWLFVSYGAIILSFLAGSLWGHSLRLPQPRLAAMLLLASNLLALLAWGALLWAQAAALALGSLVAGFTAVFLLEARFRQLLFAADTPPGYLRLRAWLTGLVLMLHLLILGASG